MIKDYFAWKAKHSPLVASTFDIIRSGEVLNGLNRGLNLFMFAIESVLSDGINQELIEC